MKEDLRVIKTKEAIKNAFISLIEEKGFENIKIIDIARRANVNRNTIYLHYESKEQIIEMLIDEIFTKELSDFKMEDYLKARQSRRLLKELINKIFLIVNEHVELYRIILTDQNLSGYLTFKLRKIKSFILESLKPVLKNEIIVEYVVSGIFGTFMNWIVYDKGSIEENVTIITDLVISNLRHTQYR